MKITKLTPGQHEMLAAARDEWLAHGLSTEPASRVQAEQGIRDAYTAAGLDPPRFVIWLGSPWAGAIGQAVAPLIVARYLQVGAQVDAQVYAQVRDQVDAQVYDQVYDQVGDQVDAQVYDQVDDQVYDQVGDQVDAQVYDQVGAQVRAQVGAQVGAQVYDQVGAQVDAQVRAQVGAQVYDQVDAQVRAQVGAQVDAQVRAQVGAQVRDQVGAQVDAQVRAQVRDQVDAQVYDQVYDQVGAQVYDQVDAQVRAQVGAQVYDQVRSRLSSWYTGRMMGQHWAGYYAWLDAMRRIGVTGLEPIAGQSQAARSAGWWWCYRHFAVVTDRPAELHRDPDGRLHSAAGMAIRYRDGWGFHAWHGRRVPAWVIEAPAVEAIAAEPNIETRRCAIEALGWDRFTAEAQLTPAGTHPDPGNPGHDIELYDIPERLWGSPVRMALVTNGTPEADGSHRRFGLTVPATIKTPLAAAAWGYDDPDHPVRVTPEVYAQLARRT